MNLELTLKELTSKYKFDVVKGKSITQLLATAAIPDTKWIGVVISLVSVRLVSTQENTPLRKKLQ